MPQQVTVAVENNFTKGLITEATALNFPENAATDADNCDFSIIGGVERRLGIDYEDNYVYRAASRSENAIATYVWSDAGGTGGTQLEVTQIGSTL